MARTLKRFQVLSYIILESDSNSEWWFGARRHIFGSIVLDRSLFSKAIRLAIPFGRRLHLLGSQGNFKVDCKLPDDMKVWSFVAVDILC